MINITSKELEIESELKKKIEFICDFCTTKPTIINGNIRNITRTNLSYVEPYRIIIKGIAFLTFNYSKTLYVGNLSNKLELKDLEQEISRLEKIIQMWQHLWQRIQDFFQNKFFSSKNEDEIYGQVLDEILEEEILDNEDMNDIQNNYYSNEKDSLEC